jgi:hypothetical protein
MTIFLDNDENIIFDITHSFRDSVIMSVISTIVTQTLDFKIIKMIFAKEVERFKEYNYELVGQNILNTANISFLVTTFLSTLKVPKLNLNDKFYTYLSDFSAHFVSNQFKTIYEKDIPQLKEYIKINEERLFFIKPLLKELLEMLTRIEKTKEKENYEKFLFLSNFFLEKDYFLQSSAYLIEVIPLYIGKVLKDLHYIDFDLDDYQKQQLIVQFIKFNASKKDFNFPHKYFLDVNSELIKKFTDIRDNVAEIRNNLAHINMKKEYSDVKNELKENLNNLQNLIKEKVLYNLTNSDENREYTITYKIELYSKDMERFLNIKTPMPSFEKIINKYKKNELDKLIMFNYFDLKQFLDKNQKDIAKLIKYKKENTLLLK